MHHTRCYQIVDVHATNHQATKVHLTGKHGTWKKPFETVSKPLSSRNQNKFPSLTPRTTKHHHASHTLHELSLEARKAWIQTGLCTLPLFGTVAQHSIDVIIAWALIGEWSSRVLFPHPDGQWPRHGHPQWIGEFYL